MTRPLRIEFPGAIYHVTSRGDRRESIFENAQDERLLLYVLENALERFSAHVMAWCFMRNHYHLVLQTREANLSRLMRHINGTYTQRSNHRHGKVGHVFQGRFHAVLIDRDAYLLEACRYVDLNPVRAGLVNDPADWHASSYRAHIGWSAAPPWLNSHALLTQLTGQLEFASPLQLARARQAYREWVAAGHGVTLWKDALQQQVFLGDSHFIQSTQKKATQLRMCANEVPREQRATPLSLDEWLLGCATQEEAIACAYLHSHWTMTAIAKEVGLSVSRVSRIIRKYEESQAAAHTKLSTEKRQNSRPDPLQERSGGGV